MPEKENDNVIQLDANFNILDDILKKEPEAPKPESKIGKLQEYLTQHKKIAVLLAILFGILILAFIFLVGLLLTREAKMPQEETAAIIPPKEFIINKSEELIANAENLEALLKKANFLYTNGNKQEALELYGKISSYSEVLSNYNLGLRSEDPTHVDEYALMGNARSFYPFSDMTPVVSHKTEES